MNQEVLKINNLNFSFSKETPILKDISFSINKGTLCIIAGANGSGKSVLLKCIKGLLKPQSGNIEINSEDLSRNIKKRRSKIGLVFQDADSQIVGQTVEKDILFGMENLNLDNQTKQERLYNIANLLDLDSKLKRKPRELSGGEKRRLAIAGILVMNPDIIFLDEPFANLDYPSILQVLKTLLLLQNEGHTIIIVSHEIDKIAAHSQKIILLEKGRVIQNEKSEKVLPYLLDHGVYVPKRNNKLANLQELSWLKH
ncbi:MAG: energy-coupling factor ABC transporter ATP-binding protein [Pleomorphochaeta sp.]